MNIERQGRGLRQKAPVGRIRIFVDVEPVGQVRMLCAILWALRGWVEPVRQVRILLCVLFKDIVPRERVVLIGDYASVTPKSRVVGV